MNPDMAPVRSQATLYPNWVQAQVTKPQGSDPSRPYRTPRQDADLSRVRCNQGLAVEQGVQG